MISQDNLGSEEKGFEIKIGPPWLTRFERAKIIGIRALQISLGAPVLVEVGPHETDAIRIAEKELESGLLPIIIVRWTPEGKIQEIPLKYLKLHPP
ncbi:MAG: DNA-directed RNA polymerase subunit K [Thermofilum sp.]|jgi:DNA-directed RNA polymerase I, II, and III subunit RPABC2/DNA-directed RNA polymerase subunit K|uniref:DNA-directed RNA polymerase subunit Rpo6 n=1 Tax=Thermofilum adornatum TaxID=1365176 RepID=A0A7C1GCL5_9CREN|nr:DNA-directed RNA polymerase subunit K [Thermofilum sp.]MCC5997704.1 DNA-directed RNA polymerase subunit K [Thermofilum sp.]